MAENHTGKATEKPLSAAARIGIGIGAVLLLLLLIGGSLLLAALRQLRGNEQVPIVSRDSEYVVQTMEDTLVTLDGWEDFETAEDETQIPEDTDPPTDTADAQTEASNPSPSTPIYQQNKNNKDILNILLLGRDSRNAAVEWGRTDAMLILSYNKKTKDVKLISLMRDTLIPIEGHDYNRINTAYAYGGIGLCINTVNAVFQLDIQDYVTIDFNGLTTLVDAIGGIDIPLTADEVYLYKEYGWLSADAKAGVFHVDGKFALNHARNRTLGADFERTRRQRDILMAIFERVTATRSLTEITALITQTLKMVNTNLSAVNLASLAADVMSHRSELSVEMGRLPFNNTYRGAMYKGMYIISIDFSENIRLLHEFLYGS